MNGQPVLSRVLDEAELDRLEAQFLLCPSRWETGSPAAEMLASVDVSLGGDQPDETLYMTRYRTRSGCCG